MNSQVQDLAPSRDTGHSDQYNVIRPFENQRHEIQLSDLQALGATILKHGQHGTFGICLLHRHVFLPDGFAMVHSRSGPDANVCRMEPIGKRQLFPCAYHLTQSNNFTPFEYSDTPLPIPYEPFLSDAALVLREMGLHDILGISHISLMGQAWLEQLLPNSQGTITTPAAQGLDACLTSHVVTEWAIVEDNGLVCVRALKGCTTTEAGSHRRDDIDGNH